MLVGEFGLSLFRYFQHLLQVAFERLPDSIVFSLCLDSFKIRISGDLMETHWSSSGVGPHRCIKLGVGCQLIPFRSFDLGICLNSVAYPIMFFDFADGRAYFSL